MILLFYVIRTPNTQRIIVKNKKRELLHKIFVSTEITKKFVVCTTSLKLLSLIFSPVIVVFSTNINQFKVG